MLYLPYFDPWSEAVRASNDGELSDGCLADGGHGGFIREEVTSSF